MTHKIIKVKAFARTCYVSSKVEEIINVYIPEDATPTEIEETKNDTVRDWMNEQVEWGWDEIEEDKPLDFLTDQAQELGLGY